MSKIRDKHNKLVAALARANERREKALNLLMRAEANRVKAIKAVVRSQKRLDKVAGTTWNNGPTASALSAVINAPVAVSELPDDGVERLS
jgi:hypothetical protein